jgi:hypothetical protein
MVTPHTTFDGLVLNNSHLDEELGQWETDKAHSEAPAHDLLGSELQFQE